ncbi:MAG: tetraacyldisaccharide 4'-kinase [Rhizobiales bacterium PAR1]|nr:MAG: tetraacyldisaccharide 4'-kinase [Rhizobiales bacterium PAR1]
MKAPGFWQQGESRLLASLLAPLGWIYGKITLNRMAKPGWRAPVPVISIGNFTAGGAGKTPTAMAVVTALQARGETPFVLTRGYGGHESGPLRVDTARHTAADVGDEPLLLARHAATIVARDRAAGAHLAVSQGATCLVLDDALQNPALAKDFSLAVIDGGFGFGNGFCVPAGPLRAPVSGQLEHVDAVLVIGEDETGAAQALAGKPLHVSHLMPDAGIASRLHGTEINAFCGIGRPEKFRATLEALGADVSGFHAFGDHHTYSDTEAQTLLGIAGHLPLVTTEKDLVRLKGSPALDALAKRATALPVTISLPEPLLDTIYRAIDSVRKR